ncbi:MAG: HEAT repeat domain-containing protein [Acidobacteriia bacterium]|nr:HEAT repeat domain-containing protein [Terriglobia bacterium]
MSSTAQLGKAAVLAIVSLFKPGISERFATTFANAPEPVQTFIVVICAYLVWFLVLHFVLVRFKPLAVLNWNEYLAKLDWKLPKLLGEATLSFRCVLLVGLYRRSPRLLDAWVAQHIDKARRAFIESPTYTDRKVYVPLPGLLNGTPFTDLKPQDIQEVCGRNRWCILIRGEGGSGKTTLACQLALWGMAEDPKNRLIKDCRMLPVLIEPGLSFDVLKNVSDFRREILGNLKRLVDEMHVDEELLNSLLETRRVLVILDGLSEMPSSIDDPAKARLDNPDFPAAALLVTSRNAERLREDATLLPGRVEKDRLFSFISTYVTQNGCVDIGDSTLFDACKRLADMLSDDGRETTPLLARMYAEQLVTLSTSNQPIDSLPATIPDLMLGYVSNLSRYRKETQPDNPTLHRAAQVAGWNCLKETFRPARATKALIRKGLEQEGLPCTVDDLDRLNIVRTIRPAETEIQFVIDPLAEYLAAMWVVEYAAAGEDSWRQFLADADSKPGAPEAVRGFLAAVHDCCLAVAKERSVPDFVVGELAKRICFDPEVAKQSSRERRIRRLIDNLQHAEEPLDREYAANELGKLGPEAHDATPALIEALKDSNVSVWGSARSALARIGNSAIPALVAGLKDASIVGHVRSVLKEIGTGVIPSLIEALKNNDGGVRDGAVRALADFGPDAKAAVPPLIELMKDNDDFFAGDALGSIGAEAVPALVEALAAGETRIRCQAACALGRVRAGAEEAVPALVAALNDDDRRVRVWSVMALDQIGATTKGAVPALIEALKNADEAVRYIAADALGRIGVAAKEAVPALIEALHDDDSDVRDKATEALKALRPEAETGDSARMPNTSAGDNDA